MIMIYCMLIVAISVFSLCFITLVKETRKDFENIGGAIEVGLGLLFFIGMMVFVIIMDYETSNAEEYMTNEFTFVYSTESTDKRVKFIDVYGREQDLGVSGVSGIIGGDPSFEIKDENILRYKVLANKKKSCTVDYVSITKDVADMVEYPYAKTLEASTTTKED